MKPDYMKYDGWAEEPPYTTEGDEVSASELNALLYAIRDARDELFKARNEKCTCSGFVLQYEGGCQCGRGKKIAACEQAMWRLVESI